MKLVNLFKHNSYGLIKQLKYIYNLYKKDMQNEDFIVFILYTSHIKHEGGVTMRSIKKSLSLILVLCMAVAMLAGCGNSEDTAETKSTATEAEGTTKAADEGSDEEMAEINIMILAMSDVSAGSEEVIAEINKITEEKINTHVNIEHVEMGTYVEQVGLRISGNEKLDLVLTTPIEAAGFSSMTAQNQLMPLNDLLEEYAPDTLALLGDYIKGTTINDTIYSLPTYRALNSNSYLIMRKDILDELGLTEKAQSLSSWTEFEEILSEVTANKEIAGIAGNDGAGTVITLQGVWHDTDDFAGNTSYDSLGDTYKIIAVDEETDTVYNYFAADSYQAMIERVRGWYESGYVYKDSATSEEQGDTLLKTNVTFSTCVNSEIGVEVSRLSSTGYEVICPMIVAQPVITGSLTKFTWGVPVTSTEPEAAVKFLNLMYTDKDIANLLTWGVEGRDYVVKDGEAVFPEGVDATTVSYHTADFLYGNQFLVYPWEGQGADFREVAKANLDEAGVSKYVGFSADTSSITNELSQLTNVIDQYKPSLESGAAEPAVYDEFIQAMEAAGVDKVIEAYQIQLDAWLAEQ